MKKIVLLSLFMCLLAIPASGWTWIPRTQTETAANFCGKVAAADSAAKVGPLTDAAFRGMGARQNATASFSEAIVTSAIHSGDILGSTVIVHYTTLNGAMDWAYNPLAANSMRVAHTSAIDTVEAGGRGFTYSHPGVATGDSIRVFWEIERLAP